MANLNIEDDITQQKVYPNPTNNQQFFITETSNDDVINVFDIRGRKINILQKEFNTDNGVTRIKLSSASSGLYVLRVNGNSKIVAVSK